MVFFTSDTHFGHWTSDDRNIIKYCNRPFSSIEEMDEALIKKWNGKVSKKDQVYILGDFFLGDIKLLPYFTSNLNGEKIFLKGDHDRFLADTCPSLLNIVIENQPIVLCHWAMRVWWRSHYNSWNLFGHSHNRLKPVGKSLDVGVDGNNFEPWSFLEVKAHMDKQPDNPNFICKKGDTIAR